MMNDWDARDGMGIGFDVPIPMDDGIVLRIGFFGKKLGGDHSGRVANPFDIDVGHRFVKRFLVRLDLIGFQRGVDKQVGLL